MKTYLSEYDVFCKHQGQLVNQGYTFCYAGHDPSKCNECEFREPEHIVTKFTTTSYETKPEKFVSLGYWGDHVEPGQIWEEDLEHHGWIKHEGTRINVEHFTDFEKYFERKED